VTYSNCAVSPQASATLPQAVRTMSPRLYGSLCVLSLQLSQSYQHGPTENATQTKEQPNHDIEIYYENPVMVSKSSQNPTRNR